MVGLRRLSTFSKDFFSETTGPFLIKFHIHAPDRGGMKGCSNGSGHIYWAALPNKVKTLKKSFSSEPLGQLP